MEKVDFLILGSGISGLYLALQLAELGSVIIVTKDIAKESNTNYAQGGIASVIRNTDSFQSHISDTLNAGSGLCFPSAVELLVREGPRHIQRLLDLGTPFIRDGGGDLNLRREGGHSESRIVHANDATGQEIEKTLLRAVTEKKIPVFEHHCAVELITQYHLENNPSPDTLQPSCFGAYVYNRKTWSITPILSKATIIATGGAGQVYLHTTNPEVATGDGIALAYRAGAEISNIEFYQFHPTTLYQIQEGPAFLLSEVLRGHGAKIYNQKGEKFLDKYDAREELAPRDIVARAIDTELKKSAEAFVYLDSTHLSKESIEKNFPYIYKNLIERGIDMSKERIPIVPAAHYMCGGVKTNLWGQTCIENLYALGEVACTGVHGGNRLGSNSLLEGLVYATRIFEHIKEHPVRKNSSKKALCWEKEGLESPSEWVLVKHNMEEVKKIMWNYVGIVRTNERLIRAKNRLQVIYNEIEEFYKNTHVQNKILELRNLVLVAKLIVASAMSRKESRGLHYNMDYPFDNTPSDQQSILTRYTQNDL